MCANGTPKTPTGPPELCDSPQSEPLPSACTIPPIPATTDGHPQDPSTPDTLNGRASDPDTAPDLPTPQDQPDNPPAEPPEPPDGAGSAWDKLIIRHKLFLREYLIDYNPQAAYLRAGYNASDTSVHSCACKLLHSSKVQSALAEIMRHAGITRERLVQELAALAFGGDPADYHKFLDGTEHLGEVRESGVDTRAVSGVAITHNRDGETRRVTFHDRAAAIAQIAKLLGLIVDKTEVSGHLSLDTVIDAAQARAGRPRAVDVETVPAVNGNALPAPADHTSLGHASPAPCGAPDAPPPGERRMDVIPDGDPDTPAPPETAPNASSNARRDAETPARAHPEPTEASTPQGPSEPPATPTDPLGPLGHLDAGPTQPAALDDRGHQARPDQGTRPALEGGYYPPDDAPTPLPLPEPEPWTPPTAGPTPDAQGTGREGATGSTAAPLIEREHPEGHES